jgi:anti-sigma B factor antagonist
MDGTTIQRPLSVEIAESPDGTVIVTLAGEFDLSVETLFAQAVTNDVVLAGHSSVVLDLAAVTFLDSSGIRALLVARRRALACGTRLVLRRPSPPVQRVLTLTGLSERLEIAP